MKELIQTWNWKTAFRLLVLFLLLLTVATAVYKKVQKQYDSLLESSNNLNTEISYKLQSLDKLTQNSLIIYIALMQYEANNSETQKNIYKQAIDSLQIENSVLINRLKNLVINTGEKELLKELITARENYVQTRTNFLAEQSLKFNVPGIEKSFINFRAKEQALVDYEHTLILQTANESFTRLLDLKYRINTLVIGFVIVLLAFAFIAFMLQRKLVLQYNKLKVAITEKNNAAKRFASILNTLPANIALINKQGNIMEVNDPWKTFADENGFTGTNYGIGLNYIDVAQGKCYSVEDNGAAMANALKQINEGVMEKYSMVYPCHSSTQNRWFKVIAAKESGTDNPGIVLMHLDITQQHEAEEKIKQSEANLRQIINLVPHPISARDVHGKFILANSRFEEMYGIKTTGKLINKLLIDTIPDKDEGRIFLLEDYEVALSGKIKIMPETFFTDYNKESHRLHVTKVPYFPLGAENKAILEIAIDITEQRKAELELKKAEANYREIFDKANEGIFILETRTGKIINANQKSSDLTGFSKEELTGNYPGFMAAQSTSGKLIQVSKISETLTKGQETFEWELKHKNSIGISVEVSINKAVIAGNERLVLFFHEIGERKKTEAALKKSEANLQTIFNSTDIAFILLDKNLNIRSYNDVASVWAHLVFDTQLKEGNNLAFLFNELWKLNADETMQKMLSGEAIYREVQLTKPGGKSEWYMVQMNTVTDDNTNIIGFCLSASNITESKFAEAERVKMTEDLIQRNKDLEQFAYIVSHNLRSPVANIMGISNALQTKKVKQAEETQMKNDLNISVLKLDTVIKDLNHILQVKREVSEQKEFVRFNDLVTDIKMSIADMLQKNNVTFVCDFTEPDSIFTLKTYMYSILFNLITNSIKYRKFDEAPLIEIKSCTEGCKTIIIYKDNGLGIDLEKKGDQVFGLYKRFHFHTEGKGTGLFMVKTQVETLGGHISIQSHPNKGTEFRIELEN